MEIKFDYSVLRENFPDSDIRDIAQESSSLELEEDAKLLLNKSAIFFLAKLIAEGKGAQEEEVAKILKQWNFEQFDLDAKKAIEPKPLPKISTVNVPSFAVAGVSPEIVEKEHEQTMQMKLMGLLQKKGQ